VQLANQSGGYLKDVHGAVSGVGVKLWASKNIDLKMYLAVNITPNDYLFQASIFKTVNRVDSEQRIEALIKSGETELLLMTTRDPTVFEEEESKIFINFNLTQVKSSLATSSELPTGAK
jgi:hypothetical protein